MGGCMNNNFIDLINIFSFVIGMQNLNENEVQSAKTIELLQENNIEKANDRQAHILLKALSAEFEQQNKAIAEIQQTLKEIVKRMDNNDTI